MPSTIDVSAYIGEFEEKSTGRGRDAISADAVFYGRDEAVEFFNYDYTYIPPNGKFNVAIFDIKLTVATVPREISTEVNADRSIAEFSGKFRDERDGQYITFYLTKDETRIGFGTLHSDRIPDEIELQNRDYYIVVELSFDEHETIKYTENSGISIETHRKRTREKFEDVFGIEYR